ncbi:hypothetical protein EIN_032600 [Entamoeba invadens IP1]|uniref:Uncharacterized protein n=1 Tax=Entamoeba invadens IP1 TaxID=370355 RepID=A0A0A1TYB8_ENTIV|nr:hypothetical protein EIN_032600 [Entamoeba invadens IP1]ELP86469.1 hypothetical protein EIN_032600 [Entamoeba invadens IP1]|eukprot:XP_004185815.1 hypothetical protein EIN_032600 [Entamoeba invadens IP1]
MFLISKTLVKNKLRGISKEKWDVRWTKISTPNVFITRTLKHMSRESYRETRNYQAEQQAVFLYLLNKHCTIELLKPIKKSSTAQHFFRIESIEFGSSDKIKVNKLVESRLEERYKDDLKRGITSKTAKRRSETGRFAETLHLLMDLLQEFGYLFEVVSTKGRNGSLVVQTVTAIYKNKVCIVSNDKIFDWGNTINNFLSKKIGVANNTLLLKKNAEDFQSCLLEK